MIADTKVIGNQAVVIHIPANESNQVAQISLTATLSNTGIAFSQTGNVSATGLRGNATIAVGNPGGTALQASSTLAASTSAAAASTAAVDLRDTNYAIADSGDALAIGVQAHTAVQGVQRIIVIIDDNSSGNRIEVVFHVVVANSGSATAVSGQAVASGQTGNLQVTAPQGAAPRLNANINSTGTSTSGAASAIGVDATTLIDVLQDVDLEVGNNSSNNRVDAQFDVDVSNTGMASATSGSTLATGLNGQVNVGPAGHPAPGMTWNASQGSVVVTNMASGRSGDASTLGLQSSTHFAENQKVDATLGPSGQDLRIAYADRVVNLGLARSATGDVAVIAQVVPPPAVASPAPINGGDAAAPAASPQPTSSTAAAGPQASGPNLNVRTGDSTSPQSLADIAVPAATPSAQPAVAGQTLGAAAGAGSSARSTTTTTDAGYGVVSPPSLDPAPTDRDGHRSPWFAWQRSSSAAQPATGTTMMVAADSPQSSATSDSWWLAALLLVVLLPALAAMWQQRRR